MTEIKRQNPHTIGVEEDLGPVLLPPTMDFVFKGLFGNEKKPEILISFLNELRFSCANSNSNIKLPP